MEIVDLSMEIYTGMPVYKGLPEVNITMHASHEQWAGVKNPTKHTPSVNRLDMGEHTGTHVDAISHMGAEHEAHSIETMPLEGFYTRGICIDLSEKQPRDLITVENLKTALTQANLVVQPRDTVLIYTDHYRRAYGTEDWIRGPGLNAEATIWLGNQNIAAFGVETMAPGVSGISNKDVHRLCGEMGFTHYENLINLHQLIGRGAFRFIGLPLKIRGGTGSPVRAVAVFE